MAVNKWQVWTEVGFHSSHTSYRDAVDQADMVHGWVTSASGLSDRRAHRYAVAHQGCDLGWDEWQAQDDDEREEWEMGMIPKQEIRIAKRFGQFTVEGKDNSEWVAIEPGHCSFGNRDDAQDYVDGWLCNGGMVQVSDFEWFC